MNDGYHENQHRPSPSAGSYNLAVAATPCPKSLSLVSGKKWSIWWRRQARDMNGVQQIEKLV